MVLYDGGLRGTGRRERAWFASVVKMARLAGRNGMKKIKIVAFCVKLFWQHTTKSASVLIFFSKQKLTCSRHCLRAIFLEADGVLDGVLSQAGLVAAGTVGYM